MASKVYFRTHWRLFVLALSFLLLDSWVSVAAPWLDRHWIDIVVGNRASLAAFFSQHAVPITSVVSQSVLFGLALYIPSTILLRTVAIPYVRNQGMFLLSSFGFKLNEAFKTVVNSVFLLRDIRKPLDVGERLAEISYRLNDDPNYIMQSKSEAPAHFIHCLFFASATFGMLYWLYSPAAWFILGASTVVGLIWVPYYVMMARLNALRQTLKSRSNAQAQLLLSLSHSAEMLTHGDTNDLDKYLTPYAATERALNIRIQRFQKYFQLTLSLIEETLLVALLLGIYYEYVVHPLTGPSIGTIVSVLELVGGLRFSIKGMFDQFDRAVGANGTMRGTNDRIYPAPVPAIAGAKRVRPHQIRFENASFRKTKNFSYTFEPGYTQINGANGGGKTSMLYTAAGVSQPTEGRALISDAQGVQRDAFFMDGRLKRSMRFIPSQPQVVVFQHVAGNGYTIGAERYLTPRQFITEEDPSRDLRRLKRFDAEWLLEPFKDLDRPFADGQVLSDGERKRLVIARALCDPELELLFMDEPETGFEENARRDLDAGAPHVPGAATEKLARTIRRLTRQGINVIAVMHHSVGEPDWTLTIDGNGHVAFDQASADKRAAQLSERLAAVLSLKNDPYGGELLNQLADARASRDPSAFDAVEQIINHRLEADVPAVLSPSARSHDTPAPPTVGSTTSKKRTGDAAPTPASRAARIRLSVAETFRAALAPFMNGSAPRFHLAGAGVLAAS